MVNRRSHHIDYVGRCVLCVLDTRRYILMSLQMWCTTRVSWPYRCVRSRPSEEISTRCVRRLNAIHKEPALLIDSPFLLISNNGSQLYPHAATVDGLRWLIHCNKHQEPIMVMTMARDYVNYVMSRARNTVSHPPALFIEDLSTVYFAIVVGQGGSDAFLHLLPFRVLPTVKQHTGVHCSGRARPPIF